MHSSQIVQFSNSFALTDTDIIDMFQQEHGWQNKYRRIMLVGKTLPQFEPEWQLDEARVQGCESDVWLHAFLDESKHLKLAASSNAKIVRGLVAIVLAAFNNKTSAQVLDFDTEAYFEKLGILAHLSPSRGNGIIAIVDAIKALAKA